MASIAVAATAPFGADVLRGLASRHEVVALVTRPDARQGRGRHFGASPAKLVAHELGIPVREPERPGADLDLDVATVVICAYGLLVPDDLLARYDWLNVHPSLLPRWRGAAPVERAILAGDGETGVTIHRTVAELDAGPVAAMEAFPIGADDDAGAVFGRAATVAVDLLDRVLEDPDPLLAPQREDGVTYAEKISAQDRLLDLAGPPREVVRRVRALSPHIGARATLHGRPVTVWRARVDDEGAFEPLEVQPESGRRMGYAEWLRGLR
jgi:methionyl-tRNA formyltransferase